MSVTSWLDLAVGDGAAEGQGQDPAESPHINRRNSSRAASIRGSAAGTEDKHSQPPKVACLRCRVACKHYCKQPAILDRSKEWVLPLWMLLLVALVVLVATLRHATDLPADTVGWLLVAVLVGYGAIFFVMLPQTCGGTTPGGKTSSL